MLNNISFGSKYSINIGTDTKNQAIEELFHLKSKNITIEDDLSTPFEELEKQGILGKVELSAPDKYDKKIETFLKTRNIDFHKQYPSDNLKSENILKRITMSEFDKLEGYSLRMLDTKKIDRLLQKKPNLYIGYKGKNGIGNRYQNFIEYLKTGKPINATSLYLSDTSGELTATIKDGRHRYAVMRDRGMKKIPFALNKESIETAIKHGLL